jgi:hypothetical protein
MVCVSMSSNTLSCISNAFTTFLTLPNLSPSPSTCRVCSSHQPSLPAKLDHHPHLPSDSQASLQQHPFPWHPAIPLQIAANLCPCNSLLLPCTCPHCQPHLCRTMSLHIVPIHCLLHPPCQHLTTLPCFALFVQSLPPCHPHVTAL